MNIHSLEAMGDKCLYFQNPMLSGIYNPNFSGLMNGCKVM